MANPTPRWTPQKTLVPCMHCGCTLLRMTWDGTLGRWTKLDPPLTPLGALHDCTEARARWVPLARALAGDEDERPHADAA